MGDKEEPPNNEEADEEEGFSVSSKPERTASAESETDAVKSHETLPGIHSYQIKPILTDKFKGGPVREVISTVLHQMLGSKSYNGDYVKRWTVDIANEISARVTDLKMKRYKHIVQIILGERKGAGIKSGVRCLWDSDTDGYTSYTFTNDSIFCLAVVYAIYLY